MKEWYSISDLLALKEHGFPITARGWRKRASIRNWDKDKNRSRNTKTVDGEKMEYHYRLFDEHLQSVIIAKEIVAQAKETPEKNLKSHQYEALWDAYSRASANAKKTAVRKNKLMRSVSKLEASMTTHLAVTFVAQEQKVSSRTLYRWMDEIKGYHKTEWVPALLPKQNGTQETCEYDAQIYDQIAGDYLRKEEPSWAACYRRTVDAAKDKSWGFVPTSKTLRRHLDAKVPRAAQILARKGKSAAAALFPAQERDHAVFHAMQAVNADGHVFDVFVKWEDGTVGRPCMVGFQDVFSGMVLSHRISKTENKDTVRLAIADMVESWGIPEIVYFDNGRAFSSKWLTGGMKFRFRFKVKEEEPKGILINLGVDVHFVRPYHGQAKPIERAWRDMAEDISRHPKFAGAYTGNSVVNKPDNYGSKAIPIEEFRKVVAQEIMRHNTRTGRRSAVANGRSFAQAFKESLDMPTTLVRKATELQRQFFLMAGEGKTARRGNGEIHLAENRYWHPDLVNYAGKKMMIRFDPEYLHSDLHVYTLDGRFITKAPCIEKSRYDSLEDCRENERTKRKYLKAIREVLDLERRLTAAQVAAQIPDPEPMEMPTNNVVGMIHGNHALKPQPQSNPDEDAAAFARGLTQIYPRSDE